MDTITSENGLAVSTYANLYAYSMTQQFLSQVNNEKTVFIRLPAPKQKLPSVEWLHEMWYAHTTEYYRVGETTTYNYIKQYR